MHEDIGLEKDFVMNKLIIFNLLIIITAISSCSRSDFPNEKSDNFIISETDCSVTYVDNFGTEREITKNPERVVIAFNSILGLWYYTGGTSLTKARGSVNVPAEAVNLVDLGSTRSLSIEAIIALEPQLVILAANINNQVAMAPILEEIGIEVMIIDTSTKSYSRFLENSLLFSKINGTEKLYEKRVGTKRRKIENIISKARDINVKPSVAVIMVTNKNMKIESADSLTGEVVHLLGGKNIIDRKDINIRGKTRMTFSIESLLFANPEIIMFSSMGSVEGCKENISRMISSNPVWSEMDAVKNNRVYYLPKEYSVYKPNENYDKAFLYIGSILYPEVFSET